MPPIPAWSDLPPELLSTISTFLSSKPLETTTFRSVCRTWRSSTLPPQSLSILSPHLPLKTPPPPPTLRPLFTLHKQFSLLSITSVYALHRPFTSPEGFSSFLNDTFLLFVDELNPGNVCVRLPFSHSAFSLPINFPQTLNLLDFSAVELGRFHSLTRFLDVNFNVGLIRKPVKWGDDAVKVVLSSDGSAAVGLFDEGRLGFVKLDRILGGRVDGQWEMIHDGKGFRFDDIVEFKGRVLGIDRRGRVYEIGCCSSTKVAAIVPAIRGGGGRRKRLVVSLGMLYLVVRCSVGRKRDVATSFKVYELNEYIRKWVAIDGLGDRVFLFGMEFSFSASAQKLDSFCGKNCILFKEQSFEAYNGENEDKLLFDEVDRRGLRIGVCQLDDDASIGLIGSHPGFSDILWPPPTWFWPIDKSKRLGGAETVMGEILSSIPENFKAKFNELPADGAGASSDNFLEKAVFDLQRVVHRMKKVLVRMLVCENYIIDMEKSLLEVMSRLGHSKLKDLMGNFQMGRLLALTETSAAGTLHLQDWLSMFQSEDPSASCGSSSRIRNLIGAQNGVILEIEELASEMEKAQKRFRLS